MKFTKLIKGYELLYLPEIQVNPKKTFFLMVTEDYNKDNYKQKVVITDKHELVNKYNNLDEIRKDIEKGINYDNIIFVDEIISIKKYSERKENYYQNIYKFLKKYEKYYLKIEKWSKLFSTEKPSLFYSPFFNRIRKYGKLVKIRFFFLIFINMIKGVLKYIILPFIFIIDMISLTFEKYRNYKISYNKYKFYDKDNLKAQILFRSIGRTEYENLKKEYKNNYHESKKDFLNTNIAFLTFLMAVITLIIAQMWSYIDKTNLYKKLEEQKNKIELMNNENYQLQDIEKLINEKSNLYDTKSENEIIQNEKIINELIKLNDNPN